MSKDQTALRLSRETVRELSSEMSDALGGAVALTTQMCQRLTIPPTLCGCTGTETATNICCVQ